MNDPTPVKATPEPKHPEKRGILVPVLLSVLIAALAIQGWYLMDVRNQLDDLRASNLSARESLAQSTIALASDPAAATATLQQDPDGQDPARAGQTSADQSGADQSGADQSGADQSGADQSGADQSGSSLPETASPSHTASTDKHSGAQPPNQSPPGQSTTGLNQNRRNIARNQIPSQGNVPPHTTPRSPFDDPFFQRSHPYGFNNGPYDWDPYRDIERMQREMDAMMRDAFNRHSLHRRPNINPHAGPGGPGKPQQRNNAGHGNGFDNLFETHISTGDFDIEDRGDSYLVKLTIPGADKNHIKVDIDDQTLTVSGEQQQSDERTDQFGNTTFKQQMSSSFKRRVTLPGAVKPESMHTRFNDDVLEILVSKAT